MKTILAALLGLMLLCQGALAAVTLDGSANGHNATAGGISVSLTTASANDLIVAVIEFNITGCATVQTGSISDGSSLTWTFRKQTRSTTGQCIAEYTAPSAGTLAADSITYASGGGSSFNAMTVMGVSGTNNALPFDCNIVLPSGTITGGPMSTFSTTSSNDFVLASGRMLSTSAPTADTTANWVGITSGVSGSFQLVEYQIYASPQTSVVPTAATGAGNFNGAITDAFTPSPGTSCGGGGAIVIGD